LVDTCAAEFKAKTPYYYSTFEAAIETADGQVYVDNESVVTDKKKVIVLGSGPNRIGQGIEFDYSCVHGVLAAKECGYETIMINCNPETVSTDFDTADKLYFEPVFWEHIYDIIRHEKPEGVIVQLGGQTALKLAEKLDRYGIKILGTSFDALDLAEDRGRFSELLQELKIPFPQFGVAENADQASALADILDFPLLVRPSYVLGGQGMKIVINKQELEEHVIDLLKSIPGNKLLLDHYLDGAIEAEADAICDGENVYIIYGDYNVVGDNTKTSFDGTFEFPYLRKGNYRIFVVSKDSSAKISNKTIEVLREANITEKKQVVNLDQIIIFD
jgi:carbamoyl-phosphate synthase large subunit